MVKIVDNVNDIANLWCEAFGDSFDDVKFFYDNLKNGKCFGYYENNILHSMLFLIKCNLNEKSSYYIYAACTKKDYRSKGDMNKLLSYITTKFSRVCLIPADEHLVEYYSIRNFKYKHNLEEISFDEVKELNDNYLFDGCELTNPFILCTE